MKEIPVKGGWHRDVKGVWHEGCTVQVDDEDYERFKHFTWHLRKVHMSNGCKGIVYRYEKDGRPCIHLSKEILGVLPTEFAVRYRDGNYLNNQKHNLEAYRFLHWNDKKKKKISSNFIGVTGVLPNKWQATIDLPDRKIILGPFKSEKIAARNYDRAAVKYLGEFAYLNFPPDHQLAGGSCLGDEREAYSLGKTDDENDSENYWAKAYWRMVNH